MLIGQGEDTLRQPGRQRQQRCRRQRPMPRTASASDGPATWAVASHGTSPSASASATGAVNKPLTIFAAAASRPDCIRNSGSLASSSSAGLG